MRSDDQKHKISTFPQIRALSYPLLLVWLNAVPQRQVLHRKQPGNPDVRGLVGGWVGGWVSELQKVDDGYGRKG